MDHFIQNGSGQTLIDKYPNANVTPSAALFGELTNNNLWFNGYYANQANGGTRVKLYAPAYGQMDRAFLTSITTPTRTPTIG